jgi:hypothetical protein
MEGIGFDTEQFGIFIDTVINEGGQLDFKFYWDLDCKKYRLADHEQFQIKLLAEDKDQCDQDNPDSLILNIVVELPPNNAPVVAVDGETAPLVIDIHIEEPGAVPVRVTDLDPEDSLYLMVSGIDFQLSDVGMGITATEGKPPLESTFSWEVGCYDIDLDVVDTMQVLFIAEDADYCKEPNADSLLVLFHILPPINDPPELYIDGFETSEINVHTGQLIDRTVLGVDKNGDDIVLRMIRGNELLEAQGLGFQTISGAGMVQAPFTWEITCDLLSEEYGPAAYDFTYILQDQQCINPMSDTLEFTVVVSDYQTDHDFLPPNVFTPNSTDNINPYYYIPDLPENNCESQFEKVVIVNRWGREVFVSDQRDFKWGGENVSTGVYYYTLKFSDRMYRGSISVLR